MKHRQVHPPEHEPMYSLNSNYMLFHYAVIPNIQSEDHSLLFKDWVPSALNESKWLNSIHVYFESCKTMEEDCENEENPDSADNVKKHSAENNDRRK